MRTRGVKLNHGGIMGGQSGKQEDRFYTPKVFFIRERRRGGETALAGSDLHMGGEERT